MHTTRLTNPAEAWTYILKKRADEETSKRYPPRSNRVPYFWSTVERGIDAGQLPGAEETDDEDRDDVVSR